MSKPVPPRSKMYAEVKKYANTLVVGTALVVDPSIGSSSSSPGWAIYDKGTLVTSNTIDTGGSHLPLWQRARNLSAAMQAICQQYRPDILVYEDIPATSGFNQNAVASLLKAVGVILSSTDTEEVLGIHPASWKPYVRTETYIKGDQSDAIEIGHIVTNLAREIVGAGSTVPRRSRKA